MYILVRIPLSCQVNVLQAYEAVEKIAVHYYSTSDQFIISAPTQDQVCSVYFRHELCYITASDVSIIILYILCI